MQKEETLLTELTALYKGYADTLRSATEPYRLEKIMATQPSYSYDPDSPVIRESLLEHVGVLPVVATAFYPYIDDPTVDLGNALIMLAVHDVGELKTGDTNVFIKADDKGSEQEAAFTLIDASYHELYRDIESQTSPTAKFAKAIDKVSADILDYLAPIDVTVKRLKHFANIDPEDIVQVIVDKKRPYMLWNKFMTDFHIMLIKRFEEDLHSYLDTRRLHPK